jgi:hypothetical protein
MPPPNLPIVFPALAIGESDLGFDQIPHAAAPACRHQLSRRRPSAVRAGRRPNPAVRTRFPSSSADSSSHSRPAPAVLDASVQLATPELGLVLDARSSSAGGKEERPGRRRRAAAGGGASLGEVRERR